MNQVNDCCAAGDMERMLHVCMQGAKAAAEVCKPTHHSYLLKQRQIAFG
jgi:hypothetical protein